MSMFTADPSGDALRVRWAFSDMSEIANVSLERADQSSGPWSAISADRRVEGGLTVAIDRQVEAGHTYYYRLVAETTGGETLTFGPVTGSMVEAISKFALSRPTPNPTQGSVTMEFSVPRASYVRVSIVDVQGREVAKLADGDYRPGRYTATWDAARAGGAGRGALYFARYQTPAGTYMRRIVVTP
jgi:hypothetical protein